MTADAESQRLANVEGTRNMLELADAVEAGHVHMISSIAAAGLYRGTWREDMFDEAENLAVHPYYRTKHEAEGIVRQESGRPWRVYRPGIVVGHSETGEMDKIDGPYYFFKLIRRIRNAVPQWMPLVGIKGGEINVVPVDFVARAIDHIAHLDGLDGKAFHLTDPAPHTAGEVIDIFARAAHAPESRVRVPAVAVAAQVLEQQIPDELLRFGRRLLGTASLEKAVRGRIVMVTGASSGIGRSAAIKIGDAGGTVLLVARTAEKLEATRDAIESGGGSAFIHQCDLADMDDIDRLADEVLAQHGHVDVLVNNAGRSIRRSIALSYDRFHDFERTMQLNFFGAVKLIVKLLPAMRERRQGHLVNVSSIGVQTNTPRFSAYVASKAALDAFSRCIASEIVDDGVYISTIFMPLVRTPMIAPTRLYDRFPAITPDEAADLICDAIIHKPKRIATPLGTLGQILYAINPKSVDSILNSAYHLFPDSRAAREGGKEPSPRARRTTAAADRDEQASPEQVAFAYLMRGIHW